VKVAATWPKIMQISTHFFKKKMTKAKWIYANLSVRVTSVAANLNE